MLPGCTPASAAACFREPSGPSPGEALCQAAPGSRGLSPTAQEAPSALERLQRVFRLHPPVGCLRALRAESCEVLSTPSPPWRGRPLQARSCARCCAQGTHARPAGLPECRSTPGACILSELGPSPGAPPRSPRHAGDPHPRLRQADVGGEAQRQRGAGGERGPAARIGTGRPPVSVGGAVPSGLRPRLAVGERLHLPYREDVTLR